MSNVYAFPVTQPTSAPADPCYGFGHRMLTERHVRKLVEREAIPYRKVGRLLRFSEPEIEEWTRPTPRPAPLPSSPVARPRPASRPRKSSYQRISMSSLYP
jgi:excisionase family DNA binding protein